MAEISHSSYRDLTGRDLVAETISGLQLAGVLREDDDIVFAKVAPIAPAYVIYTLDHEPAVKAILEWLTDQGIRTVGRFGEWEYFNMDQAIGSGRDAVWAIEGGDVIDLAAAEAEEVTRVTSR